MKKTYKLKNLGCAHCAAKMETAISKLDGVQKASVNFMLQKLTIEAEDEKFETVLQGAKTAIRKIEPDCTVLEK